MQGGTDRVLPWCTESPLLLVAAQLSNIRKLLAKVAEKGDVKRSLRSYKA